MGVAADRRACLWLVLLLTAIRNLACPVARSQRDTRSVISLSKCLVRTRSARAIAPFLRSQARSARQSNAPVGGYGLLQAQPPMCCIHGENSPATFHKPFAHQNNPSKHSSSESVLRNYPFLLYAVIFSIHSNQLRSLVAMAQGTIFLVPGSIPSVRTIFRLAFENAIAIPFVLPLYQRIFQDL